MTIEFTREDCPDCGGSDRGDDWDGTCLRCVGGSIDRAVDVCDNCGTEFTLCGGCGGFECACGTDCRCESEEGWG